MEGEAAEQEAEAEQRGPGGHPGLYPATWQQQISTVSTVQPGGHPGVYPGTWQQQILGSSGTRIATITPLAGTERSAGTGHQAIYLQSTEHYSEQFLYPGKRRHHALIGCSDI